MTSARERLVATANTAHLQRIEELSGRINRLEEELASRVRQVHQLDLTVKELNKQLREAREQTRLAREAHLATAMKNSQTSSLAPSQDRRKRTKSLRERSGRKPGGQVGDRGATKEPADVPDHLIIHAPESCSLCGSSLNGVEVKGSEGRQVHDWPPPKLEVIEHQAQTKVCQRCGTKNKAKFPAGVNARVQYGAGIRSVATYLMGYQLLSFERCAGALGEIFNCQLSAGTLATIFTEGAREMVEPLLLIKEGISRSQVIGVDETNLSVKQKQQWVDVSSTEKLTLLCHDKRRGTGAIEKIGILASYKGVCVHDGFTATAYDQ